MPPKAATANNTRRKAPSFKPPRPVDPAAQPSTTAKRAPTAAASRSTGAAKPPAAASNSRFQPATTIISSDEEQDDEFDLPSDLDELMQDAPEERPQARARAIAQSSPPIPPALLARLFHEHVEEKNTQITQGAMDLFGNYIGIFVREAIARAKEERSKAARSGERSGGFLQVEDLEKLAPQLVLDF
ncbi:hypothetical protein P280DRAFT_287224 [Massarina eburnea CBS 473.64]|uniref:Uncharacterized protein n=1 Tax=Massarina eburnea CBS 473.64 TaxID=1395130 RepID=A0A6A6S445_9PLEO|nr:hypothetical protein P280DRAFT_287224 [Massarina eburnea CBS 473.64]